MKPLEMANCSLVPSTSDELETTNLSVLPVTVGDSVVQPVDVPLNENLDQSMVFAAAIASLNVTTTSIFPGVEAGLKVALTTVGGVRSTVMVAEVRDPKPTRSPAATPVADT